MSDSEKIKKIFADLLLKKETTLDEKNIIFQFLLIIYGLRPAFIADPSLLRDNKDFLKKLLRDVNTIEIHEKVFFYNSKDKNKKIIKDVLEDIDSEKVGKALGYLCYNDKRWGDHFNSDRYNFKLRGYFNNDPWDLYLYNFVCSRKYITLTNLKKYGNELINKYTTVLNSVFKNYGIKFTFFYEIDSLKSVVYYLDKIKKKDQIFIKRNKKKYIGLLKRIDYKKSKVYKMLNNLNDDNIDAVYNFLYYLNSDDFLTTSYHYIMEDKRRLKKFTERMNKLEDFFIKGDKNYREFLFS